MKKISDMSQMEQALLLIEEVSAGGQSTNPERDWKDSNEAACAVYRIAHAARNPECMSSHPDWGKPLEEFRKKHDAS